MDEVIERITAETTGPSRHGHEARYRLAAGYCCVGDDVLDAACGIGYGARILNAHADLYYHGVDRAEVWDPANNDYGEFECADLQDWEPNFRFDVAVSFETIEHLEDPAGFIARICSWTRDTIIASVPTVPTTDANPFHLHDFTPGDLPDLFAGHGWALTQFFDQPSEQSGIYVFSSDG